MLFSITDKNGAISSVVNSNKSNFGGARGTQTLDFFHAMEAL